MQHFYFKYMIGNEGIDRLIKHQVKNSVNDLEGLTIPLSIYFGRWKSDELSRGLSENTKKISSDQIELFYNLADSDLENYLWIFYKDKIIKTKVVGKEVYDGLSIFIDEYNSLPKSIDVLVDKVFNKIELPEAFSNINSNQGYNRKTITKLKNTEEKIAITLCCGEKLSITYENLLDFLSPTEFETLLFLVFSNNSVICSSYRGGTLKDYDLRIKVLEPFHGIPTGSHWIQIKYKKNYKPTDDTLTVCLDKSDLSNNIIGSDWLLLRIKESPVVKNWIINMIYDYPVYKLDGI